MPPSLMLPTDGLDSAVGLETPSVRNLRKKQLSQSRNHNPEQKTETVHIFGPSAAVMQHDWRETLHSFVTWVEHVQRTAAPAA